MEIAEIAQAGTHAGLRCAGGLGNLPERIPTAIPNNAVHSSLLFVEAREIERRAVRLSKTIYIQVGCDFGALAIIRASGFAF